MIKVYGVFSDNDLEELLSSGIDDNFYYDLGIRWYNRTFESECAENIHSAPEVRSNISPIVDNSGVCFFLYLDDALKIAQIYQKTRFVSFEIDDKILRNNLFLREFWINPILYDYGMYHCVVPKTYLKDNLEKLRVLDAKFIEEYYASQSDRQQKVKNYPSAQRDYLTSLVSYYTHWKRSLLSYHLERATGVGDDNANGSDFLSLAGALLYPSINWIDAHVGNQQLNQENIGYSILDEALKSYDWNHDKSDFFNNYRYLENQTLLVPTETTLYHILSSLTDIGGQDASYSEIFKKINDKDFMQIIEMAAQKTFDHLYVVENGIIQRRTTEAIESGGTPKQLKPIKRN